VFGDIGTSPLYAIQIVFALSGGLARPTSEAVYGVASLEWFHLPDRRTITLGWQVPL
jgi:KUP system potassium uptake protein